MAKELLMTIDDYRLSKFVIKIDTKEGWVFYNTLTASIVSISDEEDLFNSLDDLIKMYYYVPNDFDEVSFVNLLREQRSLESQKRPIDGFTILTTTDCNARCYYCYEKGQSRITMTEKTAYDVAYYIIKSSSNTPVNLRWFGGEPLVNTKAIDIISNILSLKGVVYSSTMVSNGLLFNEATLSKATKLWKLRNVQITLDGTKDVYQKVKSYLHTNGNEFDIVIDNISKLIKANISVSIRLNQDFYNTENLLELTDLLSELFKEEKGVSVYNCWLYDENLDIDSNIEIERYEKYKLLQDKIIECGLYRKNPLKRKIRFSYCMADNDSSIMITPDGSIGKCEHFINQHLIGSIYSNVFDSNEISKWKEKYQPTIKCNNCPLYPQCVRIKMCPEERNQCSLSQCENRIELIKRSLLQKYRFVNDR